MPVFTSRDVHVDVPMTNILVAYKNPFYIADEVCPVVPVTKQSNIIPKLVQSHWFRNQATVRAPGTKSRRGGYETDNTSTYFAKKYSFGHEIPDEYRDNADSPYDLDRQGTEFVGDKLLMAREVAFATDFMKTGVWGTDKVGATDFTKWSSYATSTPLVNLTTFRDDVEGKIGREPNTLVLGKQVWAQLKWHPDVIDTIKYTQTAMMTTDLFARLLEFDRFLVGRAVYTTSAEGTAEASVTYTRIWGKDGLMLYTPPNPGIMVPAACYTFAWQRVNNAIQYVRRVRDEEAEMDILEGNSYWDQVAIGTNAALFMDECVA